MIGRATSRRLRGLLLVLVVALFAAPAAAQAAWSKQTSKLSGGIVTGTSCPDSASCVQVQVGGAVQYTTTGGATWTKSGTTLAGSIYGLHCAANSTTCFATAVNGDIYKSSNLGKDWSMSLNGSNAVYGIECPSTLICFAVGAGGRIQKTVDGGSNWNLGASQTGSTLYGVSCPSSTICYAIGASGDTYKKRAASDTWDQVSSAAARADIITPYTSGISCPSIDVCYEGGSSGVIAKTSNGGTDWNDQTTNTAPDIYAMSCASDTRCMAVGVAGDSIFTDNGGANWSTTNDTGSPNAMYSIGWMGSSRAVAGDAVGATYVFDAPQPPDATLPVSGTLNPGTLSFIDSTPANVMFPTRALTNADQTVTAAQPLVVADATGSGNGWSIAVTSTTFTTGSRTLSNLATKVLAAPTIACRASSTCTPATNTVTYPFQLPASGTAPTAQKLFSAPSGTGLGAQTITPTWTLQVPATAYSGTYTSTWTFTLTTGP